MNLPKVPTLPDGSQLYAEVPVATMKFYQNLDERGPITKVLKVFEPQMLIDAGWVPPEPKYTVDDVHTTPDGVIHAKIGIPLNSPMFEAVFPVNLPPGKMHIGKVGLTDVNAVSQESWDYARDHLLAVIDRYENLPGMPLSIVFVLGQILRPLKARYEKGERTIKLYEEMKGVE